MRIRLTPFDDENERGALLHMLPTIFKASDAIQAVGLKDTIGAFGGRSRFRHWPFGEVLLHVFEAEGNRASSDQPSSVFLEGLTNLIIGMAMAKRPCSTAMETLSLIGFRGTGFMAQIARFAGIAGWCLGDRLNRVCAVVQDVWS
jgi:hypothetical protein